MNPALLPRNKSGRVKLGGKSQLVTVAPEAAHGASTVMQAPAVTPSPAASTGGPAFEGLDPFSLSLVRQLPKVRPPRPEEDISLKAPDPAIGTELAEPLAKPPGLTLAGAGKALAVFAVLAAVLVIANRIMAARAMAAEIPPPTPMVPPPESPKVTYL